MHELSSVYHSVLNAHAYTIEFFSDTFIEPIFQKENRLIKKQDSLPDLKVIYVKILETPYKL